MGQGAAAVVPLPTDRRRHRLQPASPLPGRRHPPRPQWPGTRPPGCPRGPLWTSPPRQLPPRARVRSWSLPLASAQGARSPFPQTSPRLGHPWWSTRSLARSSAGTKGIAARQKEVGDVSASALVDSRWGDVVTWCRCGYGVDVVKYQPPTTRRGPKRGGGRGQEVHLGVGR